MRGRRTKMARKLKYTWPGMPGSDHDEGDGGKDGGAGVREPRRPIPPKPMSAAGAMPLPEPLIEITLPGPRIAD